jgi:hypothetical protein
MTRLLAMKGLLEANGIPAVIQGDNMARMFTPLLVKPGLWVYLDSQAGEARALLEDPEYEVVERVDVAAFHAAGEESAEGRSMLNRALLKMGFYALLILIAMFLLIQLLRWLATG